MLERRELNKTGIKMLVTFVQAFLAVWAVSGFKADKVIVGGAIGAGLSAVYNLVLVPLFERLNK